MLKAFRIHNFKSIREATAEFSNFCGVVGLNAAGKSNLVQAFDLMRGLIDGIELETLQRQISLVPKELFYLGKLANQEPISLEAEFNTNEGIAYRFLVKIALHENNDSPEGGLHINYEKLARQNESEEWITIYERTEDGSLKRKGEGIPLSFRGDQLAVISYDDPDASRVREFFQNSAVLLTGSLRMPLLARPRHLDRLSRVVTQLKKSNPKVFKKFEEIIKQMLPRFSSFKEIVSEPTASQREDLLVVLQEENLSEVLSMMLASEGDYRTMFVIARALSMPDGALLIIEEIENGLHPHRLFMLVEQLETITKIKKLQLIFTTHSPSVINRLRPQDILYVFKKKGNGTDFVLLSKSKEVAQIQDVLEQGGKMTDVLATIAS